MKKLSYYKTIASFYDTIVPRDIKGICDSVEEILRGYTSKKEILDLGCGTGRFAIELAKRGYRMTGLDITNEMLEVAQRNARKEDVKVRFIKGDIRNFQLKKKIGIIWARGSIGDLLELNDVQRAFENIKNNLSKKGIFVFDIRNYSDFLKTYKNGYHHETRNLKKKNSVYRFNFVVKINTKSKIAHIQGDVTVKGRKTFEIHEVNHMTRSYTKKQIVTLLCDTRFEILQTLPGYMHEQGMELGKRIVAVAQR